MKSLKESLFSDNIKSDIVVHGEIVDPKLWKECKKSFEWFRKDIIKNQKHIRIGEIECDIIYNESDCVIMKEGELRRTTIISPETIWYNYVKGALKNIQTSGDELIIDDRDMWRGTSTFYNITFAKRPNKSVYYSIDYTNEKYFGYTPETISDKAKKIMEMR